MNTSCPSPHSDLELHKYCHAQTEIEPQTSGWCTWIPCKGFKGRGGIISKVYRCTNVTSRHPHVSIMVMMYLEAQFAQIGRNGILHWVLSRHQKKMLHPIQPLRIWNFSLHVTIILCELGLVWSEGQKTGEKNKTISQDLLKTEQNLIHPMKIPRSMLSHLVSIVALSNKDTWNLSSQTFDLSKL